MPCHLLAWAWSCYEPQAMSDESIMHPCSFCLHGSAQPFSKAMPLRDASSERHCRTAFHRCPHSYLVCLGCHTALCPSFLSIFTILETGVERDRKGSFLRTRLPAYCETCCDTDLTGFSCCRLIGQLLSLASCQVLSCQWLRCH